MPRKKIKPKRRRSQLPDWLLEYFRTGKKPEYTSPGCLEIFQQVTYIKKSGKVIATDMTFPEIWKIHGAEIVKKWQEENPDILPFYANESNWPYPAKRRCHRKIC